MSARSQAAERRTRAPVFAALGDETRLLLVARLCNGAPQSISQLTEHSHLTRQAISKHLRVLKDAGVVRNVRKGRENMYAFKPEAIDDIKDYLDAVSKQWDQALSRLKAFVED